MRRLSPLRKLGKVRFSEDSHGVYNRFDGADQTSDDETEDDYVTEDFYTPRFTDKTEHRHGVRSTSDGADDVFENETEDDYLPTPKPNMRTSDDSRHKFDKDDVENDPPKRAKKERPLRDYPGAKSEIESSDRGFSERSEPNTEELMNRHHEMDKREEQ